MKKQIIAIAILGIAFFLSSGDASGKEKIVTPTKELLAAIQKTYPDSSITKHNKFQDEECGKNFAAAHPGIISADFNGDKVLDYAVLLIKNKPIPQEKGEPFYEFIIAAFLGQPNKQFKAIEFWKFVHPIDTPWMLLLHDEKTVLDYKTGNEIKIKYPAIRPTRCGGGHCTIYWNGKDFITVQGS